MSQPPSPREKLRLYGSGAVLVGLLLIPVGFAQLLAEGPHGPNGEVTGAPFGGVICIGSNVIAIALLWWAGQVFKKR